MHDYMRKHATTYTNAHSRSCIKISSVSRSLHPFDIAILKSIKLPLSKKLFDTQRDAFSWLQHYSRREVLPLYICSLYPRSTVVSPSLLSLVFIEVLFCVYFNLDHIGTICTYLINFLQHCSTRKL